MTELQFFSDLFCASETEIWEDILTTLQISSWNYNQTIITKFKISVNAAKTRNVSHFFRLEGLCNNVRHGICYRCESHVMVSTLHVATLLWFIESQRHTCQCSWESQGHVSMQVRHWETCDDVVTARGGHVQCSLSLMSGSWISSSLWSLNMWACSRCESHHGSLPPALHISHSVSVDGNPTRWLTLVLTGVNRGSWGWDCPRMSQGDIWSVLHLIWIWMRLVFAGISWMVAIDQRFIEMIRTVSGDSGRRSGGPPATWSAPTFLPRPRVDPPACTYQYSVTVVFLVFFNSAFCNSSDCKNK